MKQISTFPFINRSIAEETIQIITLELGPLGEAVYQERETFRYVQKKVLEYLQTSHPTDPEQFFKTTKEWLNALESLLVHYIDNNKKITRILEQAEGGKIN